MILYRYFRRFGLRWAIFGVYLAVVSCGIASLHVLLIIEPNGWALVAVLGLYATHRVTEAFKSSRPLVISLLKPSHCEISDSTFSLAGTDLDRAVERLVSERAQKKDATP